MEHKIVYTEKTLELYLSIREFEIIRNAMQVMHFSGEEGDERKLSERLNCLSGELRRGGGN